jgi:hypothetical protein
MKLSDFNELVKTVGALTSVELKVTKLNVPEVAKWKFVSMVKKSQQNEIFYII